MSQESLPTGCMFVMADPSTCIGCKTCMAACLMRSGALDDVAVPRLVLVTTRTVSAPIGCHHCADAPCVNACPTGCLYADDGYVGVRRDTCIGCRNCILACPYGAIDIVTRKVPYESEPRQGDREAEASGVVTAEVKPTGASGEDAKGNPKGARARAAKTKRRRRSTSTVVKCDLCIDRADGPACVKACPTKALRLIDSRFIERGRQAKHRAAARATAECASLGLNATLDEEG